MKKLFVILLILSMGITHIYAFTWEDCIKRYDKAKQFSENTRLFYNYLKSTKNCLVNFKDSLVQNPDPEFTVEAMDNNIVLLDKYIDELIPNYSFPKNSIEEIPKYKYINSSKSLQNKDYTYIKKFKNCNGVHANNKIYTAKHCEISDSKNLHYDLDYIKTNEKSNLKTSKININKKGVFKYYSMSKEGRFYSVLLQEKECSFYKAKNSLTGLNTTLDLTDLKKDEEIRSNCLAIPSNSGGGVFQDEKLVAIISKTVFEKNKFLYSVVEPIVPLYENIALNDN